MTTLQYWIWTLIPFPFMLLIMVDPRFSYFKGGSTCAFAGYFVGIAVARYHVLHAGDSRGMLLEMWFMPLIVAAILLLTNMTWFHQWVTGAGK